MSKILALFALSFAACVATVHSQRPLPPPGVYVVGPPIPVAGPEVAATPAAGATHLCPAGQTCTFDCDGGNCAFACEPGSVCQVECDGGNCLLQCDAGAVCHSQCDGGNCHAECAPGASCAQSCDGGNCS